jgi:hypothetical protein
MKDEDMLVILFFSSQFFEFWVLMKDGISHNNKSQNCSEFFALRSVHCSVNHKQSTSFVLT